MGRTRLDPVTQEALVQSADVIFLGKCVGGKDDKHPKKNHGDEAYNIQCTPFEIVDILRKKRGIMAESADLHIGEKVFVAKSASDMFHSNFVHNKKTGGYRSFAIDVYVNADEPVEVGKVYLVYATRCSLNDDLLEFCAQGSWDKESEAKEVRKKLGEEPSGSIFTPRPGLLERPPPPSAQTASHPAPSTSNKRCLVM